MRISDSGQPAGLPLLPYNGTSGHARVDTSRDATAYLDASGITAASQRGVWVFLRLSGPAGATVKEIREARSNLGHHGRISGALSVLHQKGLVARLLEKRDGSRVYVLPRFLMDRAHDQPASRTPHTCPQCGAEL